MSARLVIDGTLKLTSPLAIGAAESSLTADRPVQLDDDGRPVVPGQALAGVIRSTIERLVPALFLEGAADVVESLLGGAREEDSDSVGSRGVTSRLRVHQARLVSDATTVVRDGVGIHRGTGAARNATKYDLETVETGARFQVRMDLEERGDGLDARCQALLAVVLDDWQRGHGSVGGRVGTGLGRFRLDELRVRRIDLGDRATLQGWLRARPHGDDRLDGIDPPVVSLPAPRDVLPDAVASPTGRWPGMFNVDVRLRSTDPVLVGGVMPVPRVRDDDGPDPDDAGAQPMAVRAVAAGGGHDEPAARFPFPGSSLRGVLRTTAEQIVRTLGGSRAACDPLERRDTSPLWSCVERLRKHPDHEMEETENRSPSDRRAASESNAVRLTKRSCPVCRVFGSTQLAGRLTVSEGNWVAVPGVHASPPADPRVLVDHVAIDRFTGGAADDRKFDTAPLLGVQAESSIRLDRPEPWEVLLVLLALRDVAQGWVPVGSRGRRGFGRVAGAVTGVELRWLGTQAPWAQAGGSRDGFWHSIGCRDEGLLGGAFLGAADDWDWFLAVGLGPLAEQALAELKQRAIAWHQLVEGAG